MLKKLIGIGMALTMALTVGFGFTSKADAGAPAGAFNFGYPHVGKDGHVYATQPYGSYGQHKRVFGLYKMYDLNQGIITAVNVYDDTDIIRFSENIHEYKSQGFIEVTFSRKYNNDYAIASISRNHLKFSGLLNGQELDNEYDVYTYKITWADDNYVYLYTKNHPNPHEIKLPKEGFEFLTAGDWLWAKVSEETWKWVTYGEITPNGLSSFINVE